MNDLWSVYDEMREMRDHLLTRIELLEDEVEHLTQENMDFAKELYTMQRSIDDRIDILVAELTKVNWHEGQESSKEDY
jgi:chaperonin cofactor prefoldin